jgi:hypothetical protein
MDYNKVKIFNDTMSMIQKSVDEDIKKSLKKSRPFNPEIVDSEYKRQMEERENRFYKLDC